MKTSLEMVAAAVVLALGAAGLRQEPSSTQGVPAPPPQWGSVGQEPSSLEGVPAPPPQRGSVGQEPSSLEGVPAPPPQRGSVGRSWPMCPPPVCPPPASAPTVPPCPDLSCPEPVCPVPVCPVPVCPSPVCPQPSCPPPPAPSSQACPATSVSLWKVLTTYDHFQGFGFYKLYEKKMSWHQAKAHCTADGGHLGIINSEDEADIFKLLSRLHMQSPEIFIGIHNLEEQNWKTVTGEPLSKTGYIKWRPNEPNGLLGEHCGTMYLNGMFNDNNCNRNFGFICEVNEKKVFGCK